MNAHTAPTPPYVLVRPPADTLQDGIVTFIEAQPLDVDLARRQWRGYVDALEAHGFATVEVGVDHTLPDSVFIEDAVVIFGDLAVVTNPKEPARNPETVATEKVVVDLGLETATITEGNLDGGDVLKVGTRVYVGLTGTTDLRAVAQLRDLLEPRGWTVTAVPVTKALHLKSAITALPDGTIIGFGPVVDDPSIFERYLEVPEEPGCHVVVLDEETVLMSSAAPRTEALLRERGLEVVTVDISEFEKLEGCVTCLSVRVRG
ncbi:MAG: N(G),N(G)-dimethylarginine dimethylaminohydrolase [Nocardioides sp.]|uniref:dimethylargininase n=1 Tax=Nocardioides sp. TaxID=35761 RepID=UPI0039E3982E